jgi:hypothetical protein
MFTANEMQTLRRFVNTSPFRDEVGLRPDDSDAEVLTTAYVVMGRELYAELLPAEIYSDPDVGPALRRLLLYLDPWAQAEGSTSYAERSAESGHTR